MTALLTCHTPTHQTIRKDHCEVKFSLTHFSKHYSERDTASDPTDSDTNEGEPGLLLRRGKLGLFLKKKPS